MAFTAIPYLMRFVFVILKLRKFTYWKTQTVSKWKYWLYSTFPCLTSHFWHFFYLHLSWILHPTINPPFVCNRYIYRLLTLPLLLILLLSLICRLKFSTKRSKAKSLAVNCLWSVPNFSTLLRLMPDNFTRQGETSRTRKG